MLLYVIERMKKKQFSIRLFQLRKSTTSKFAIYLIKHFNMQQWKEVWNNRGNYPLMSYKQMISIIRTQQMNQTFDILFITSGKYYPIFYLPSEYLEWEFRNITSTYLYHSRSHIIIYLLSLFLQKQITFSYDWLINQAPVS